MKNKILAVMVVLLMTTVAFAGNNKDITYESVGEDETYAEIIGSIPAPVPEERFHEVYFKVTEGATGRTVSDAGIHIWSTETDFVAFTNENGKVKVGLKDGWYYYSVNKKGFIPSFGRLIVNGTEYVNIELKKSYAKPRITQIKTDFPENADDSGSVYFRAQHKDGLMQSMSVAVEPVYYITVDSSTRASSDGAENPSSGGGGSHGQGTITAKICSQQEKYSCSMESRIKVPYPGQYKVILTATDELGQKDVRERHFYVKEGSTSTSPRFEEIDFDAPRRIFEEGRIFIAASDKDRDLKEIGWYLEGTIRPQIGSMETKVDSMTSSYLQITGASKLCSSSEAGYCEMKSSIAVSKPGNYTVIFYAEDKAGHVTEKSIQFSVNELVVVPCDDCTIEQPIIIEPIQVEPEPIEYHIDLVEVVSALEPIKKVMAVFYSH